MARPTKKTPDVKARVIQATRLGATRARAADAAGIAERTLYEMLAEDTQFAQAIKLAEGEAAVKALTAIQRAASGRNAQWQAAAWLLERRYPHEYGRTVQEQTGQQKLTIEYTNNWRSSSEAQVVDAEGGDGDADGNVPLIH